MPSDAEFRKCQDGLYVKSGLDCPIAKVEFTAPREIKTLRTDQTESPALIDVEFSLPKGQSLKLTSAELFGIFFDVTYAYRFGHPAHSASVARLTDGPTGEILAEAFHFPHGRGSAVGETGLATKLEQVEIGGTKFWALHLTTQRLAQSVHIAAEGVLPRDDWFHLAPGEGRRILLGRKGRPSGVVTALNGVERIAFG